RDVELQHATTATERADFCFDGIRLLASGAAMHDDVVAVGRSTQRDRATDAARGTRDEDGAHRRRRITPRKPARRDRDDGKDRRRTDWSHPTRSPRGLSKSDV